jgi:hypothetical protein
MNFLFIITEMPFKVPRHLNSILAGATILVASLVCMATTTTAAARYNPIAYVSTAEAQQMIEVQAGGGNAQLP